MMWTSQASCQQPVCKAYISFYLEIANRAAVKPVYVDNIGRQDRVPEA